MAEQLVRRAVDAFMARDVEALLTEAERPLYHGHEGVRDWFQSVFGVFPDWRPRPRTAAYDENGAVVIGLDVTATSAGGGVPVDQTYWLGARVEADKITFFGFFRTEPDAMDAVT